MAELTKDVFHYLDYRAFLRDRFEVEKTRSAAFSYRYVARRVGVKTPGHLKRIVDGERRLTEPMALRYAELFQLSPNESRYFVSLVRFNNASHSDERQVAYEELAKFRRFVAIHKVDTRQAEFCREWYMPAIRELVACEGFREDPSWIAQAMRPAITVRQAKKALKTLEDLGLLQRVDGCLVQTDTSVTTGSQTHWVHVIKYHRSMLERASECIDEFPAAERDLSSVTLAVPDSAIGEIKLKMAAFRRELLAEYGARTDGERICQVSMQLFPLSAPIKGDVS